MERLQQQMQRAIEELVASGAERGLQVAVYRHGEQIVDAVAGLADPATGRAVDSGTPFYVYSTGKGVTATLVHILAERGLFDYDTPIAALWPEFGAQGKERATIGQALSHTVGVPSLPADTTPEEVCDWDRICARVAATAPSWEPGTKTAYHAYTFGYILGEVIRRATGKPLATVLREEIGAPLGIADEIYFGVPEADLGRLARLEDAPGSAEFLASLPDDSPFFALAPRAVTPTAAFGNRPDVLRADIPAGGKMSARAVARMYAALIGEVDGVRLLPPERLRLATAVTFSGNDESFGGPTSWMLGYSPGLPGAAEGVGARAFGMGGVGGSYAYGDPETGIAFGMAKNLLSDFATAERLIGIVARG